MTAQARSIPWQRDRRDGGASLVEFALLAPVLFSLLLGMITGGLALSYKNSMTNAVREGARLGATLPEDPSDGWDGWAEDVKNRVTALAGGDLDDDEICVEIVKVGASTLGSWPASGTCPLTAAAPVTPTSAETDSCVVKVWARRTARLNALFFARDLTLDGQSLGLYEREECT